MKVFQELATVLGVLEFIDEQVPFPLDVELRKRLDVLLEQGNQFRVLKIQKGFGSWKTFVQAVHQGCFTNLTGTDNHYHLGSRKELSEFAF